MITKLHILTLSALQAPTLVYAQKLSEARSEAAFVHFQGDRHFDNMYAASASTTGEFFGEPGGGNLTQVQASGTFIRSGSPAQYSNSEVISLERRASLGVTQTIAQLTSIGISSGYTSQTSSEAKKSLSRWYSARAGQWWNKATILTELDATRTDGSQPIKDYTDTDGERVLTPVRVKGTRYTLSLTWLASPQAMALVNLSKTLADNRPDANSATIEGRYFINGSATAIHLKAAIYEDNPGITRKTDYGRIAAKEWETQLHQHLDDRWIIAGVYRDHFETEDPRSVDSKDVRRHSRMLQARLRHRFVTGPVTDTTSEVYVFGGQYQSIDSYKLVNHVGMGGVYVL